MRYKFTFDAKALKDQQRKAKIKQFEKVYGYYDPKVANLDEDLKYARERGWLKE